MTELPKKFLAKKWKKKYTGVLVTVSKQCLDEFPKTILEEFPKESLEEFLNDLLKFMLWLNL